MRAFFETNERGRFVPDRKLARLDPSLRQYLTNDWREDTEIDLPGVFVPYVTLGPLEHAIRWYNDNDGHGDHATESLLIAIRQWRARVAAGELPPQVVPYAGSAEGPETCACGEQWKQKPEDRPQPRREAPAEPAGMTTAEAAQLLGISERNVRKALGKGTLTGAKAESRWMVSRSGAENYLHRKQLGLTQRRAA